MRQALILVLALVVSDKVGGAKEKKEPAAKTTETAAEEKPSRKVTPTRPGSLLRRDTVRTHGPDLRGAFEFLRDSEIMRHYTRVARFDVIERLAQNENDLSLLEHVENVRRKEARRFWEAMQRLRQMARRKIEKGTASTRRA